MPGLDEYQTSNYAKMILLGKSGAGKTSALAGLVAEGYELFIMDFDNLLRPLATIVKQNWPQRMGQIHYLSFLDKMKKQGTEMILEGQPKALLNALEALNEWKDGDVSYGKPSEWGPKRILVIDSLTRLGQAAIRWGGYFGVTGDQKNYYPAHIGEAQRIIRNLLGELSNNDFRTNVIVICHIQYLSGPDGVLGGLPWAPGDKLSPEIPTYFDTMLLVQTEGAGDNAKRVVRIKSSALIDVKSPAALGMKEATLPLETALPTIFKKLRGKSPNEEGTK